MDDWEPKGPLEWTFYFLLGLVFGVILAQEILRDKITRLLEDPRERETIGVRK